MTEATRHITRQPTQHPADLAAQLLREAAAELERAAGHCRVAADHIVERNAPRMGAHAWAARGHLLYAEERLNWASRQHAAMATLAGDPDHREVTAVEPAG